MISFYYGEQNQDKLKKLIRLSMKIIGFIGAAALMISLRSQSLWWPSSPGQTIPFMGWR